MTAHYPEGNYFCHRILIEGLRARGEISLMPRELNPTDPIDIDDIAFVLQLGIREMMREFISHV